VLSLPEDGSIAGFLNVVLHSKLNNGQIPKKKKENYFSELHSE